MDKIRARLIIEIAGFPKEHVEKTLTLLKSKFCENKKEVKIEYSQIAPPKKISEKMWSGFVEFEILIPNLAMLIEIIFDYYPSSVEIIEPEEITENITALNGVLNDLSARLHKYDALIKALKAKIALLHKTKGSAV